MLIHIIYGTNSGGTQTAGEIIAETLRRAKHQVDLINAAQAEADHITQADIAIIGSCSWELVKGKERLDGQLQQHWLDFIKRLRGRTFPKQRFAVYGLGDSGYQHFCAAADHLEKFVAKVEGKQVGPTLRLDNFFFEPSNEAKIERWARELEKGLTRD